ncbi:MAG TPA: glycosyl hydrolase family 28 protein, partial [Sunxiuqinia sp.]|nr:glycosyl hydrolase family 28 protein [Sunxiuqinia sp.]
RRNVLIEYSTLNCGDDCFTMKSGRGYDGLRVNKPTENVVVRYCLAQKGHGAITCGSETAGMIKNLYVHDCVFYETGVGIRFKTRRPRGGGGENLVYERIRMNLNGDAFKWDMLGGRMYVGELADRLPARPINELTPKYKDIQAKDILIEKCDDFVKVSGIPESPLENVQIENVVANCAHLFTAHDMINSSFKNMKLTSKEGAIKLLDTRNITFNNIDFQVPDSTVQTTIEGSKSDSIMIESCTNIKNTDWTSKH